MNAEKCPHWDASQATRWDTPDCSGGVMKKRPKGEFVLSTDYDRLRNQLAQAQAEIERLRGVVEAVGKAYESLDGALEGPLYLSKDNPFGERYALEPEAWDQADASTEAIRQALSAAPSKGEVLAVVDSTVYMQDNAAWLSIIKLPPMPDQPVTVTVRRREEGR
jgi:hypothetical protein